MASMNAALNTTVQATLNLSELKRLSIPVPPARIRDAITRVLGALDDKIVANERIYATADDLARLMWLRSTRAGEPVSLSGLASFVNGKAFTKGASGHGRVVIRIAELNSGLGGSALVTLLWVR
jgi:type I restriction enzyme S subunit